MKTKLPIAVLLLSLLLSACGSSPKAIEMKKYSAVRMDLFDTVILVSAYAESEEAFQEGADRVFAELTELHRLFDAYHEYTGLNNICTVNRNAGGEALAVDGRIIELLTLSKELATLTDGRVDATAGSVLQLWQGARQRSLDDPAAAYIPDPAALKEAAEHSGFERLIIDRENSTLRLTDAKAKLDVGSIAKGFAVQSAAATLPVGWLISAGGNVYASGEKPDGSRWTVGIQDPDGTASDILCSVSLKCGAVVTSGDYQRYYEYDGKRYHHIIDLETLMPAQRWRSVTVVCEDSGIADGLSTALFVMSREEGEQLLRRYDAAALWVDSDGNIEMSRDMESFIMQ